MTTKVKVFKDQTQQWVCWGLQPIKIWMRIIAVLPPSSNGANYCVYLICHIGAWLFTASVHGMMLFVFFHWDHNTFFATVGQVVYDKATFTWIRMLNYTNNAVHCVGIHSGLVFNLSKQWKKLEETLEQSEARFGMPKILMKKYSKLCVAAIVYAIFSEGSLIFLKAYEMEVTPLNPATYRKFLELSTAAIKLYTTTSLMFFCIICVIIADQFQNIRLQIHRMVFFGATFENLIRLQNQYTSICRSLNNLNNCFGLIVLLEVQFNFISVVNTTMDFFMNSGQAHWSFRTLQLGMVSYAIINLILMCLCADNIKNQAAKIGPALYSLIENRPKWQEEVQYFTTQLSHMNLDISALGFFNIEKKLLLTLIGLTLTYILIMFQFYSSESH